MVKKNSVPIRVDTEFFLPEIKMFKEKNGLPDRMPDITREIGKMMRQLRMNKTKFNKEIKF